MLSARVGVALVAVLASPAVRADGSDGGKIYVGDEGVAVAVVFLPPRGENKVLLQVTGSGSELDGKARLHTLRANGSSLDYEGVLRGLPYHTLISRNGAFRLFFPGHRDGIAVHYDEARSRSLHPETVLAAHQSQLRDGSLAALERFDRAARIAAAEKQLAEEARAAAKACGAEIAVRVEWSGIHDEILGSLSIPSYCGAPLSAMRHLCDAAPARTQLSSVKSFTCRFSSPAALVLSGDTLSWTADKGGSNLEELARNTLLGNQPESGPPWGKVESLAERIALAETTLCTDAKSHYVVVAPHAHSQQQLFYGDGKKFFAVPQLAYLGGTDFLDPRAQNKTANPSFRGHDMRLISSVEADRAKQRCVARCGDRTIPLTILEAEKARPILLGGEYLPTPQSHEPHVLLRDELGNYYYVDRGFKPEEAKKFRLFKGRKGQLKEQKMTDVVSDSEGEIFSTKTGSLRLIVDRTNPSVWIEKGKSSKLRDVPVGENLPFIYTGLGVYDGERLGTPCDDL